jgi:hypothetical protein
MTVIGGAMSHCRDGDGTPIGARSGLKTGLDVRRTPSRMRIGASNASV